MEEISRLNKLMSVAKEDVIYHDKPYITLKSRPGYFCAVCWEREGKLVQMSDSIMSGMKLRCNICENIIRYL